MSSTILRGLSEIVNLKNTKENIDINEIERQMIADGILQRNIDQKDDRIARFEEELREAAKNLGISEDSLFNAGKPSKVDDSSSRDKHEELPQKQDTSSGASSHTSSHTSSHPSISYTPQYTATQTTQYSTSSAQSNDVSPPPYTGSTKTYDATKSYETSTKSYEAQENEQEIIYPSYSPKNEVKQRDTITEALTYSSRSVETQLDPDRLEEMKIDYLGDIADMLDILQSNGEDITRYPNLDHNSDLIDIKRLESTLRKKIDQTRYRSMSEELILLLAHGVEEAFDGEKEYFGRYKPNMKGWHKQVNSKLRRMKNDTGRLVSNVIKDNNIGPTTRLFIELLPSAILYSRRMSEQQKAQEKFSEDQMSDAMNRLSAVNNR